MIWDIETIDWVTRQGARAEGSAYSELMDIDQHKLADARNKALLEQLVEVTKQRGLNIHPDDTFVQKTSPEDSWESVHEIFWWPASKEVELRDGGKLVAVVPLPWEAQDVRIRELVLTDGRWYATGFNDSTRRWVFSKAGQEQLFPIDFSSLAARLGEALSRQGVIENAPQLSIEEAVRDFLPTLIDALADQAERELGARSVVIGYVPEWLRKHAENERRN